MSNDFYIKSIAAISKNGVESKIELTSGFNLIHGPSNTGKTLILNCIDYIFGSKTINNLTNQSKIVMEIESKGKVIVLEREIDKNKIHVRSSVPGIKSGYYSANSHSKNKISDIYLKLIGMNELPIKIIKNENFKTNTLTWRTFLHMFFLKESEVVRRESIILPKQKTSKTAFLSSFLYLINGIDQEKFEREESPDAVKLKNANLKSYINKKLQEINKIESEISNNYKHLTSAEVEAKLNKALNDLNYNNAELSDLIEKNKKLIIENTVAFKEREENSITINNFRKLLEQYKVDKQRLTMILESLPLIKENKIDVPCPFCESKLSSNASLVNKESIESEIKDIDFKYCDLYDTTTFLINKDHELKLLIENNEKIIKENSDRINNIINPSIKKLESAIKEYKDFFDLQSKKEIIKKITNTWGHDLAEINNYKPDSSLYKPIEKLPENFFVDIENILFQSLEYCSYPNLNIVSFDRSEFDMVVNGKPKADQGKGFRAYLNSILVLSMLDYILKNGKYHIPLLILDTPLLGLDEIVNESHKDINKMRIFFYDYIIHTSNNRQTIVVDNNRDLPETIYKRTDINRVEFTKSRKIGRYGFLEGIYD